MKTINMIAECIQNAIGALNNLIAGANEGTEMFKDAMEHARQQQLAEQTKLLEAA